tara:strand:+ start:12346 stop:13263 length:918 start_codon:yes stop_codon:yes gene_type:complete
MVKLNCIKNKSKIFLCFFILVLASCEKSNYLAPVVMRGEGVDFVKKVSTKTIIIKEGYTLYSIARSEGVSVRSIIEINDLKPPFIIHKGDKLIVPSALIHIVKEGDSLWNISECYGTDIITIMNANNMGKNEIIVGKKLFIPSRNNQQSKNCNDKNYIISNKQIKKEKITKLNNNGLIDTVYIWPVKGKVSSKFGIQDKGMRNDGVNILAKKGQPVLAIQDGKVVYSGNAIQSFGNLILIKHNNNRTSAYAHVDDVKVVKGQLVKKGEQIAKVSNTGKVNKPQLHLEIRDNSGPIDPLKILPSNL